MDDGLTGLIGLARKAGKAEVGEEPVTAAATAHKARLILLSSDAAENTAKRARRLGESGNCPVITPGPRPQKDHNQPRQPDRREQDGKVNGGALRPGSLGYRQSSRLNICVRLGPHLSRELWLALTVDGCNGLGLSSHRGRCLGGGTHQGLLRSGRSHRKGQGVSRSLHHHGRLGLGNPRGYYQYQRNN